MITWLRYWQLTSLLAGSLAMAGCRVDTHHNGNGGNDDVKIATPFGGMSVKTNDSAVQANVGLAAYPGATLVKKTKHKDNGDTENDSGAADINMSFGNFHLGVKALSYQTSDSPDKVLSFYRKDMARFGAVLFCKDHHAIGSPSVTQDGLTCNDDEKRHVNVDDQDDDGEKEGELKAGSKQHQHIVSVERDSEGTKIGLVMLDLPGHLGLGGSDSRQ